MTSSTQHAICLFERFCDGANASREGGGLRIVIKKIENFATLPYIKIMEEQIAKMLKEKVGCHKIEKVTVVPRSSLNTCLIYETNQGKYFCKAHHPIIPGMYEAEAKCLQNLDTTATIDVPKPIYYGEANGYSVLVLEYLDLIPHTVETEKKLGEALARLHQTRFQSPFGYDFTTFLGTTPQKNTWTKDWVDFFCQYRLLPLIHQIEKQYKDEQVVTRCHAVVKIVPELFRKLSFQPSLLHGDLWSGNTAAKQDGTPIVFDPSCYHGHAEAELSIASLFGGFSPQFFAAYHAKIPKEKGFAERQNLYQLYHLLNHYHLFGESYRDTVLSRTRELL